MPGKQSACFSNQVLQLFEELQAVILSITFDSFWSGGHSASASIYLLN